MSLTARTVLGLGAEDPGRPNPNSPRFFLANRPRGTASIASRCATVGHGCSAARGLSRFKTAQRFSVSESSVQRWCKLDQEQGSIAPKPMGGMRPFVLANELDWLTARIAEQPDVALRTLLAELHERGIDVSYYAVWNIVDSTELSDKKKPARQ